MELSTYGFIYSFICNIFLLIYFPNCVQNRRFGLDQTCLQCDQSESFSFFWKIKRSPPSPPSYFFGTIHAPYTKVWNFVPNKAKSAFRNSRRIIFELDLMDSNTLVSLAKCQLLPPGIKLIDVIPKDMYRRLKRHLEYIKFKIPLWITDEQKARGLYADSLYNAITSHWERKRPIWVMIMLNSLTENDIKSRGITVLDSFFYQKAKRLKKSIGSVENAEEQCITLNYLNSSQVLFALNQTLLQHEGIRRGIRRSNHTTDDMIRHYNCGNLNEALFSEESAQLPVLKNSSHLIKPEELEIAKKIEEYFRFEIILKRNKRMSQRVLNLLTSNPNESFFFVFGAGHFLGTDSIIELIKESGLEIIHINDTQRKSFTDCNVDQKVHQSKIQTRNSHHTNTFVNNYNYDNNPHVKQDIDSTIIISPVVQSLVHSLSANVDGHLSKSDNTRQHKVYYSGQTPVVSHRHNIHPYPLSSVSFGRNTWSGQYQQQHQRHQLYTPARYIPPVQSSNYRLHPHQQQYASSQHRSLNDLLLRSYILNKNISIDILNSGGGVGNKWTNLLAYSTHYRQQQQQQHQRPHGPHLSAIGLTNSSLPCQLSFYLVWICAFNMSLWSSLFATSSLF